ncbi:hypothetical protein [Thioclava sp. GXIMD4216]|uniref:hypothetical protein n=1 Tax=Thioclava sp. GXIMD4216 TaxID=3131929 RepID=UPI0030CAE922
MILSRLSLSGFSRMPRLPDGGRVWYGLRHLVLGAVSLGGLLAGGVLSGSVLAGAVHAGPEITVSPQVLQQDLHPFTATVGDFGNGADLAPMGFEPTIYRTMLTATRDATDRVSADPAKISANGLLRDGALDGAELEVLRIENGQFRSVRLGHVAQGGFHASGFLPLAEGRMLRGTQTSVQLDLGQDARPGSARYFRLRAVDAAGRLSEPSNVAVVNVPKTAGKAPRPQLARADLRMDHASRLSAPRLAARLTASGLAQLSWAAQSGATGYVVESSDTAPEAQKGYALVFDKAGASVKAGDLVIVRANLAGRGRDALVTDAEWTSWPARRLLAPNGIGRALWEGRQPWSLRMWDGKQPAGMAAGAGGQSYLHLDLTGGKTALGNYNHSGAGQAFYPVLNPEKTYRAEVWMRADPGVKARFVLQGPLAKLGVTGLPAALQIKDGWTRYSVEFRPDRIYQGDKPGAIQLELSGQGAVDLDNLRIYATDAGFLDWSPEDLARLKLSGMSDLRTHALVRTGRDSYDLAQLTNTGGSSNLPGTATLDQSLKGIAAAGMSPWLQIEPHLSRAEWLGLAEYLAGPEGAGPMADKRAAQGHPAPWTDSFPHIRLELGNETWNRLFAPWTFPKMRDATTGAQYSNGDVYGLYQEYVLSILRQSPYWAALEPELIPVLGGFNGSDYGPDAAAHSPHSAELTHAEYIGGWDQGEGVVRPNDANFATILSFGPQMGGPNAQRYGKDLRQLDRGRKRPLALGTYEAGPGYTINGLNGRKVSADQAAQQELAMKGVVAGTATLDAFLLQAADGYKVQNFFTFGEGRTWSSHARWDHGGQAYPSWDWLALINRLVLEGPEAGGAQMLEVRGTDLPRMDIPKMARRAAREDVPMVGAYALRRGSRLVVVVTSRLLPQIPKGQDGHLALTVDLPAGTGPKVTRYRMEGGYRASNYLAPEAKLVAEPQPDLVSDKSGKLRLNIADLPPAEAFVYVFDAAQG